MHVYPLSLFPEVTVLTFSRQSDRKVTFGIHTPTPMKGQSIKVSFWAKYCVSAMTTSFISLTYLTPKEEKRKVFEPFFSQKSK